MLPHGSVDIARVCSVSEDVSCSTGAGGCGAVCSLTFTRTRWAVT